MASDATPYRFGDLLALARRSWTLAMARELEARGYGNYRVSDAASMRLLLAGPLNVGRLASALGVTRQGARKVARGLEERQFAITQADPEDARRTDVVLTAAGALYAHAIVEVIASLNTQLAGQVDAAALVAADTVLRASITDSSLQPAAERVPPPARRQSTASAPRQPRPRG